MRLLPLVPPLVLLAACVSGPPVPSTLAEFEARSSAHVARVGVLEATGLDPVHDWARLLRTTRSVEDPSQPSLDRPLFVPEVRELDPDHARVLVAADVGALFLPNLDRLDVETARILASASSSLFLDGLRELSPRVARALVDGSPPCLSLRGLRTLGPETAHVLADLDGSLCLDGLADPSLATVRALAGWRGWGEQVVLHLGVVEPSDEVLAELARVRGWGLALDQVTSLPPDRARAMGAIVRPSLSLSGLHAIPAESVAEMASWRAKFLVLDGLTSLSDEARAEIEQGCAALSTRSVR